MNEGEVAFIAIHARRSVTPPAMPCQTTKTGAAAPKIARRMRDSRRMWCRANAFGSFPLGLLAPNGGFQPKHMSLPIAPKSRIRGQVIAVTP